MTDEKSGISICVTGAFRHFAAFREFLGANSFITEREGWLVEVRLDLMPGAVDDAIELCAALGRRVIATCRARHDGGGFAGSESDRIALLARAAAAGAGFVDVELATWLKGGGEQVRKACAGGCRVMLSVHETGSSSFFADHAAKLNATGVDAVKLAGTARDAGDLVKLAAAGRMLTATTRCVVGMGPAAAYSRARPGDFNSNVTFASAGSGLETAVGQPSFGQLESWRTFESRRMEPVVLVGGEQVASSVGPDIFNRLFRARSIPMQYLPLPAASWDQAVDACARFGIRRFAVTMPFKHKPLAQWPDARVDSRAVSTGIVNTVVLDSDGAHLMNTDSVGAGEIFDRLGGIAGMDVLIMGGGATARSIAAAAVNSGASVTVSARTPAVVQASWPAAIGHVRFKGWERRGEAVHDIVVNATPLGGDGRGGFGGLPPLRASVAAVDVAMPSQGPTPMIEAAVRARLKYASGLDFWCAQAPAQLSAFCGVTFDFDEVARTMSDTGHACTGVMADLDRTLPGAGLDDVTISIPGSKSMTQRCLVLAALARSPSRLVHPSRSRDCRELQTALGMMGARFGVTAESVDVYPADFPRDPGRIILTGEGGTTLRFLAALSLVCGFPLRLRPSGTMVGRPIDPLLDALSSAGVAVTWQDGVLTLAGGVGFPAQISISSNVSSQFASALLMAGTATAKGLAVAIDGDAVSRSYLDMTVRVIRLFGGEVDIEGDRFQVRHGRNVPGLRVDIEGDASLAAFWEAASVIYGRRILLANRPDPVSGIQGDAVYPALFDRLRGPGRVEMDLRDTPDLLPPLMLVALFRDGVTVFSGIGHARVKESDRLHVLADRLSSIGADIVEEPECLVVTPARLHGPANLDPAGDHRMAMTFGILSLRIPGLKIADPGCVDKSYPAFWQDLEMVRN